MSEKVYTVVIVVMLTRAAAGGYSSTLKLMERDDLLRPPHSSAGLISSERFRFRRKNSDCDLGVNWTECERGGPAVFWILVVLSGT